MEWLLTLVATSLVSGAVTGIGIAFLRKYLERKIDDAYLLKEKQEDIKRQRRIANDNLRRAAGRQFFWMYRQFENPSEELREARASYDEAEKRLKEIDQEIVMDYGRSPSN